MRKLKYGVAASVEGFITHEDDTYGAFMQERLSKDSEHVADCLGTFASYAAVLLGSGIRLTSRLGAWVDLALLSTKVYNNGVLLLRYAVMPKAA